MSGAGSVDISERGNIYNTGSLTSTWLENTARNWPQELCMVHSDVHGLHNIPRIVCPISSLLSIKLHHIVKTAVLVYF